MEYLPQKIDILIPIIKETFKYFAMGFQEYRKIWEPKSNEILEVKLDSTDKKDRFAIAILKNKKINKQLPFGKTGRFCKSIFYFLRCEYNDCKIKIVD